MNANVMNLVEAIKKEAVEFIDRGDFNQAKEKICELKGVRDAVLAGLGDPVQAYKISESIYAEVKRLKKLALGIPVRREW